jgi:hypothetical protein
MQIPKETLPKEIDIPIAQGIDLKIFDRLREQGDYATSSLPKGFLLVSNGLELVEEAVGFGFPVVKRGLQALFPSSIELAVEQHGTTWLVQAVFRLDLVEKIHRRGIGSIRGGLIYAIKNSLAALIRSFSPLRGLLTAVSSGLRRVFGWETTYENAGFHATIKMVHTIHAETGEVRVEVDLNDLPDSITEVVVMNEQGARHFDRYMDSSGLSLQGKDIGCWDEVTADEACFICSSRQVAFKLGQVKGARLFRGRELVSSRLAWAGFGYSFPPSIKRFVYELGIERHA